MNTWDWVVLGSVVLAFGWPAVFIYLATRPIPPAKTSLPGELAWLTALAKVEAYLRSRP